MQQRKLIDKNGRKQSNKIFKKKKQIKMNNK